MKNRFDHAGAWLLTLVAVVAAHVETSEDPEHDRGDVPGWVMITVMSAILVVAILAVFRGQVENALANIFNKIQ
ncbi:hypothetical protein FDO65_07065 [Nakamurella flava]|uniref:Uncharacterized protein n=1 Tax=Nakamurella flava TaxID=2576308 RepID=A0A4U6QLC7_9ACTN|nr:hypothetical protein [Nakamurella flava]TKV61350.1 hypothetical protein FDO65_07065 [Nakamurella flava]